MSMLPASARFRFGCLGYRESSSKSEAKAVEIEGEERTSLVF